MNTANPQQHLGHLIRLLRTDAGLTRAQLGAGTKLGAATIKSIELSRRQLTKSQLDALLRAPCMDRLLEWAKVEGITVELGDQRGA